MVIDGGAKLFQWEKRKAFQQVVLKQLDIPMGGKWALGPMSVHMQK